MKTMTALTRIMAVALIVALISGVFRVDWLAQLSTLIVIADVVAILRWTRCNHGGFADG